MKSGDGVAETVTAEVLVIGAGAAGLTAALGCAGARRRVVVLTKARLDAAGGGGASVWAQGGVASAVGEDDAPALHAADTIAAGAGLNDPHIVELLTGEGPGRIRSLLALGARFDRDAGGHLALGREAAHSRRRILHAHGDATGAEVVRTLVEAVRRERAIRVVDETFAIDLLMEGGAVAGLSACDAAGKRTLYRAAAVVLATGGLGQLYLYTTNPREATADGLAMAARAGARLVDLEFVQFHPTALAVPAGVGAPLPLLTEALRGEGAVLVDDRGEHFMAAVHPDRELAPRDVVARAIWGRMRAGCRVYLDARQAVGDRFPERFPTVYALCRRHGLDPRTEPLPVTPAAHYHMGGVAVDANGRTSLPGLWACGEVAATGAHGANRLASNSLLEALVFGARVAEDLMAGGAAVAAGGAEPARAAASPAGAESLGAASAGAAGSPASAAGATDAGRGGQRASLPEPWPAADARAVIDRLRELMWDAVGVERDGAGLAAAIQQIRELSAAWEPVGGWAAGRGPDRSIADGTGTAPGVGQGAGAGCGTPQGAAAFATGEARNLLLAAALLAQAALARRESRGGHYRIDYPRTEASWRRRLFLTAGPQGEAIFESALPAAAGLAATASASAETKAAAGEPARAAVRRGPVGAARAAPAVPAAAARGRGRRR